MSLQYDLYLAEHRANVKKGFDWLCENIPELVENIPDVAWQTEFMHDESKDNSLEYEPYDNYFYGGNRSFDVVMEYRLAWLRHLHNNPHHWQYWILINDDPKEGEVILDMPDKYIIEMICDWWSFSWSKGNLKEIFDWYDEHSKYMKLSGKTKKTVEDILSKMKKVLEENNDGKDFQN